MFDVVHVKSANNNFPTPEFAKRVNLYADPEPCIKTFRRADFLSFIMIHQKLLLRYSLLPILDEKPRRNFQHRSPNKKGSPILERSSSREEQTLLSSPLLFSPDIGLDTSYFESGHQCQDENSNNVSRRGGGSSTPRSARIGTSSGDKTRWCLSREKGSRRWKIRRAIYNFRSTFENSLSEDCSPRVFVSWQLARREGDYLERKIGSLEGFGFVWKALEHRGQDIV